ncbi:MAG: hypothetical protein O3B01_14380 [Planctomycetota bacterium]|nr:hypothetical protein [Planctomycetota bacterium]
MTEQTVQPKSRKKLLIILSAVAIAFPLVARLFVLPGVLDSDWVKAEIKRTLPFPVEIGKITGEGLSGLVLHIHEIVIPSPEGFSGDCVRIKDLTVDVSLSALARNDVRLYRLDAASIKLSLELNQDGNLNLDSLLARAKQPGQKFIARGDILVAASPSPVLKISYLNVLVRKLDIILKTPDGVAAEFEDLSLKANLGEPDQWTEISMNSVEGSTTGIQVRGRQQLKFERQAVVLGEGKYSAEFTHLNAKAIARAFHQNLPDEFESVALNLEGNLGDESEWQAKASAGTFSVNGTCLVRSADSRTTGKSSWVIKSPYSSKPLNLDFEASTDNPARLIKIDNLILGMKDTPVGLSVQGSISDLTTTPKAAGEISISIHQTWFETVASLLRSYLPDVQLEKVLTRKLMFEATQESVSLKGRISLFGLMDFDTWVQFKPADEVIELKYLKGKFQGSASIELAGNFSPPKKAGDLDISVQAPLVMLSPLLPLSGLPLSTGTTLSGQLDTMQKLTFSQNAFSLAGNSRLTNGGMKIAYVIPITIGTALLENSFRIEPSSKKIELKKLSLTSTDQSLPLNLEGQGWYEAGRVQFATSAMLHLGRIDKQFGAWTRLMFPEVSFAGHAAFNSRITGAIQSPSITGNLDLGPAGFSVGSLFSKTPGEPLNCLLSGGIEEHKGELVLENNVGEIKRRLIVRYLQNAPSNYSISLDLDRKNRKLPFLHSTMLDAPVQLQSDFNFIKTPLAPRQVWSSTIMQTEVSAQSGLLTGIDSLPPLAAILKCLAGVTKRKIGAIEIASLEVRFEKGETTLELQAFKLDTIGFIDLDGKGMVDLAKEETSIKLNIRPDLDWLNALPADLRSASWNDWQVVVTGQWNSPGLEFRGFPAPLLKAIQEQEDKSRETAPGLPPSVPPGQ